MDNGRRRVHWVHLSCTTRSYAQGTRNFLWIDLAARTTTRTHDKYTHSVARKVESKTRPFWQRNGRFLRPLSYLKSLFSVWLGPFTPNFTNPRCDDNRLTSKLSAWLRQTTVMSPIWPLLSGSEISCSQTSQCSPSMQTQAENHWTVAK